jgi:GH24 family phage-related lysozyme (muramidase)
MASISHELLEELKKHEGVRSQVYDDITSKPVSSYTDVKGAPTIAMGKKIQDHERETFKKYLKGKTELVGEALNSVIRDTIMPREQKLAILIKVPVTQSMFDAVFSFAFNTGFGAKSFKTVLDKLNAGDYKGAQAAIAAGPQTSKGKKLPGLVKRRAFEASHFAREGLTPGASALAGIGEYGAVYTLPLRNKEGAQVGTMKISGTGLATGVAVRTVFGALTYGAVGGVLGALLPFVSMKDGAKWGAIAGGVLNLTLGINKAQVAMSEATSVE